MANYAFRNTQFSSNYTEYLGAELCTIEDLGPIDEEYVQ